MCKKLTTLFIVVIITINSFGQALNPIVNYKHYIENEKVISENKLNARASFTSYTAVEDALTFSKEKAQFHQLLDGQWKFKWVRSPKERPTTFQNIDFDDSKWTTIPVPANWEVEGYDHPIYLDERYPFTAKWPDTPNDYNPVGTYRKEINLTKDFLIINCIGQNDKIGLKINNQFYVHVFDQKINKYDGLK